VGVFTSEVDEATSRTLPPLLVILGIMALIGGGAFAGTGPHGFKADTPALRGRRTDQAGPAEPE
jgi:anaerobic selenocysteine-containing dehydrogenase